jgi:hypothetical protein
MPTSEMKAVPPGSTRASAVGRGCGCRDRGDAAVEVPADRDLLAAHFGVEVDHDAVGLDPLEDAVDLVEGSRATCRPIAPLRLITPTRMPPPRRRRGPCRVDVG